MCLGKQKGWNSPRGRSQRYMWGYFQRDWTEEDPASIWVVPPKGARTVPTSPPDGGSNEISCWAFLLPCPFYHDRLYPLEPGVKWKSFSLKLFVRYLVTTRKVVNTQLPWGLFNELNDGCTLSLCLIVLQIYKTFSLKVKVI